MVCQGNINMPDELKIRNMTRSEVDMLIEWAAREGWNPGLHDADAFWATDPGAFIAAEYDSKLIGGGAITAYNGIFGFMGFFIVRPEYRNRGFGNTLWHVRRDRLLARLHPEATIGLDGVFEMQEYYARGGFVFSHRNMRFRTEIPEHYSVPQEGNGTIVPLSSIPFDQIQQYDRSCFPASRTAFLRTWTNLPDSLALCRRLNGKLAGYGVVRRCREGCKIGPLFADNALSARALYTRLAAFAAGGPLYLDAPENNPAAIELAHQHRMTEVFGCARMYLGPPPQLVHTRVFGVTTFELG
jgi:GNAT superfamily N-acetyltransferase